MNPFEYLSNKIGEKLLDLTSRAQQSRIEERDAVQREATGAAAPNDAAASPARLTPEEAAAFAQRRGNAWRYLVLPAIVLMLAAIAVFYFNPPPGIPYALFAGGFVFWLIANRQVVCPRCGAALLGKAEREATCRHCGVQLK